MVGTLGEELFDPVRMRLRDFIKCGFINLLHGVKGPSVSVLFANCHEPKQERRARKLW